MKIYIDLLLIQDTLMMATIIYTVSRLINLKVSMIKMIAISFVSSMISICLMLTVPTLAENVLVKGAISIGIVKWGLIKEKQVSLIQKCYLFWILSFLIGGIHLFFHGDTICSFVIFAIMVAFIIVKKKRIQKRVLIESSTCWLDFYSGKKEYHLKALVDTGHNVKSIYGEEVIFMKEKMIQEEGEKKKRIVRFQTIAGIEEKDGTKMKDIMITYGNRIVKNNAVIIQTPNILNQFDAIVSYDLIEGGMTGGNFNVDETKSKKTIS